MAGSIVNSGDASPTGIETLSASFNTLAAYVIQGLQDHGYQLVLGRFLSSTHPDLKDFDLASAVYAPDTKRIFVGEFYKVKACGEGGPEEYPTDFASALAHEAGHFVDFKLAGTGEYPDGLSSMREVFRAAFRRDTQLLAKDDYRRVREAAESFGYSEEDVEGMVSHFKSIFIEADDSEHEIYAEIFANLHGQCASLSLPIEPFLPQCAALVRADENRLNATPSPQPEPVM